MSTISTHVLDTSLGRPASGVSISFEEYKSGKWNHLASGTTDNDGRVKNLMPEEKKISTGIFRLVFDTRAYFQSKNQKGFYPSVTIEFEIIAESHYHVPLLLNPFGYSTYRGS